MEILLLSFLAVVLQVQWQLSEEDTSNITSSVFLGAMVGTLVLGPLGDIIGRKPVFSLTAGIIAIFGLSTALANEVKTLILMRFLVGFGVGGLTVPFDTLAEFIPTSHRGTQLMVIEYFWTFGTILTPIIAYFTLGNGEAGVDQNAWRWFVVFCSLPCLISTVFGMIFVPESPRWLLAREEHTKALAILRQAAQTNGKDPEILFPTGTRLIDEEEHGHDFCHLLSPQWRPKTIFLWVTWAGFAFVYFGTILLVTLVFANMQQSAGDQNNNNNAGANVYTFDYEAILTSAVSEVAGCTLVILIIDRIGRIPTQIGSFIAGGITVFTLCLLANSGDPSRAGLIVTAFLARMFFMSGSCTTWVATAELLSTEVRTTGHSASNAMARLGGSFSPYLITSSTPYPLIGSVMLLLSLVTAFAVWHLPETMGKTLGATAHEQPIEKCYTKEQEGCTSVVLVPYGIFRE